MIALFDSWKTFDREVIPKDASPIQREEMRRSFYAGAAAMMGLVLEAVDPVNEEDCLLNLSALEAELAAHRLDLRG